MADSNNVRKLDDGWFPVPHDVFDLELTKNELLLLIALFKFENSFGGDEGDKMSAYGNNRLIKKIKMSEKSLIKAKRGLVEKNMIRVIPGYPGKETEYAITFTDVHRIKSIKSAIALAEKKALREKKQKQMARLRRDSKTGKPIMNKEGFYCIHADIGFERRELWVKFDKSFNLVTAEGKIIGLNA